MVNKDAISQLFNIVFLLSIFLEIINPILAFIINIISQPIDHLNMAHNESNYNSYYSNYSSIRTSIVATTVLLEINGGSEHRYSSTFVDCLVPFSSPI